MNKDIDYAATQAMWNKVDSQKEKLGIKDNDFVTILVSSANGGYLESPIVVMFYGGKEGLPRRLDYMSTAGIARYLFAEYLVPMTKDRWRDEICKERVWGTCTFRTPNDYRWLVMGKNPKRPLNSEASVFQPAIKLLRMCSHLTEEKLNDTIFVIYYLPEVSETATPPEGGAASSSSGRVSVSTQTDE